jgi:hypothetical protein
MDERKELNRWLVVLGLLGAALLLAANLAKGQELVVQRSYPHLRYTPTWRPAPYRPTPLLWRPPLRVEVKAEKGLGFLRPESAPRKRRNVSRTPVIEAPRRSTTIPRPCSWDWWKAVFYGKTEDKGECS